VQILRDERFLAGDVATDFLTNYSISKSERGSGAAVAAAIALAEQAKAARTVQRGIPVAWRNVAAQPQVKRLEHAAGATTVEWWGGRDGYVVDGLDVVAVTPAAVTLEADGVRKTYDVVVSGPGRAPVVDVDSPGGHDRFVVVPRFTDPADAVASGSLLAPMPGTVVSVAVEVGAEVAAGQAVLVLEAMKMQHTVSAPYAGTVTQVDVRAGTQVAAGEVLAVVSQDTGTQDTGTQDTGTDTPTEDNEEQA
jgi:propionyl-CoA carboxylase alpha chain